MTITAAAVARCIGFDAVTDEELDELILGRLKHRLAQVILGSISDATQETADMAMLFNEPEESTPAFVS